MLVRRHDPNVANQANDEIVVVGAQAHPLRDLYHSLMRMRWPGVLTAIAGIFLAMNAVFGEAYVLIGGVEGVRPGSFLDAFFFSVETMATIGYGTMHPVSTGAHLLVVVESVVSIILTALATGIVFARFSMSSGRMVFSQKACISPMNGVPTLAFRVGNDRASTVLEARVRVSLFRTERTQEGILFYKLYDMDLVRERSPVLARSWNVMHVIDEKSPLFGRTPEACVAEDMEIVVTIVGTDDTSLQPVHARHRYHTNEIVWGARLQDVLEEMSDGRLQLDLRKFHDTVPTDATERFPYPKA